MDSKKILIVDDLEENILLLRQFCERENYHVIEAENGAVAVELAKKYLPDIILMDLMMPVMTGFEAIKILKNFPATMHIPIIVLTSQTSYEERIKGISVGANDFLLKPFDAAELSLRINNHLKIKDYQDFIVSYNEKLAAEVDKKTKELKTAFQKLDELYGQVKAGYLDTIYRLVLMAEYKDTDTGSHIKRISLFAKEIAALMGLDASYQDQIYCASPMHDVGKVGIPDNILQKKGKLDAAERTVMDSHTMIGEKILSGSESPFLKMAAKIAGAHHEKWDGTGYPHKLKGEQIPLEARIVSLADIYDALRSKRAYKPAFSHEETCRILLEGEGNTRPEHFDPRILDLFKKNHQKFAEIFQSVQ